MHLCDLIETDCPFCPFDSYKWGCKMASKEEIIRELEDMQDMITHILSDIREETE